MNNSTADQNRLRNQHKLHKVNHTIAKLKARSILYNNGKNKEFIPADSNPNTGRTNYRDKNI